MQLKYRRLIYIAFIILFGVSAVGVLLYAQGYKYNSLKKRIEKTGAITVVSDPAGAQARITQQTAERQTPLNWNRLAPDQYEVTVNLDGYQEWKKKLSVKSGQVTPSGKIKLWPAQQAGQLLPDTAATTSWQSPNRQNLLYYQRDGLGAGLWLLNLVSGNTALLTRPAADQIAYLEWSPSSRQVLIKLKNTGWQMTSLTDNTTTVINLPANLSATTMHWSATNGNLLYFATATELYEFDLSSNAARLLARDNIADFREHQGLLFILSRQNKESLILKILNPKNLQLVPLPESLPLSTAYSFLDQRSDWLPLLDSSRHQLYLMQSPLKSIRPIIHLSEAINIDWSETGQKILFYNNYEIWSYSLSDDLTELLYRVSSPITQARWYNDQYVLLGTGNELVALELDTRDSQQSWHLSNQAGPIDNLFLEPEGEVITIKTPSGLIRLPTTKAPAQSSEPPVNLPATAIQTFRRLSNYPQQS